MSADQDNQKAKPLNVVLLWHMHQPEYRDLRNGVFHQPWTYLHIIKDYVDMAAHLEQVPAARAVVNFVPVLLEQIDDYSQQLDNYLHHGGAIRDPLLAALADPVVLHEPDHSLQLIKDCLRANENRLINRFPAYQKLAMMAQHILEDPEILEYYDEQFITDLLVWYHLAWMGETVRRDNEQIKALIKKERLFTIHDRRILVEVIHQLCANVIGRYRRLAENGQIEIAMTPYAHPIVPLLLDFTSAREAVPDISLPTALAYPDGERRSEWHIQHGLDVFERFFGFRPKGCWPSEGSVSSDTVAQLSRAGFSWLATGETVLRNSLTASNAKHNCIHNAYQLEPHGINCFFRDDGISDLIGFKFQDWHGDDAVANLLETLKHIASACQDQSAPVVSIILDGENAWEHYPKNGYYFLSALYEKLAEEESINLTTYSEYLNQPNQPSKLTQMVAGSWVYGSFTTWIGMKDKNTAWDMLVDAKKAYDKVMEQGQLPDEEKHRATMQLATCESSDWFWWFGDYNPSDSVRAFDEQYRLHLSNLYQCLQLEPPEYLSHSFSMGSQESTATGVMLPGKQN